MTPDQIKSLRELRAKATPGPWEARCVEDLCAIAYPKGWVMEHEDEDQNEHDAQLIAEAVNNLDELLDAAEDCDMWEASAKEHMGIAVAQSRELDRYKKALEVAKSYIRDHCDWQVGADAFEDVHSILAEAES